MGNSIEDVLINNNYNQKKKNGHPFLLILIFLLLIALGVLMYLRFFYVDTQEVDYRKEFFEYTATNNSKIFLNDTLYSEILKKIETRDYEAISNINFSTTQKIQELEDIDVGKLLINIDFLNRQDDEKKFFDLNLSYLDNEIINCKLIKQKDEVYVTSNDIMNMYIGGNKNEFYPILSEILSKEIDFSKLEGLNNILKNRIEYSDIDISKYYKIISDNVEISNIRKKENVIIQKEEENITTNEYELKLSKEQVKVILQKILELVKEDKKILNKLIDTNATFNEDTRITRDLTPVGEGENEQQTPEDIPPISANVEENQVSSDEVIDNTSEVQENDEEGLQRIQNNNLSSNNEEENNNQSNLSTNPVIKANINQNVIENTINSNENMELLSKEEAFEILKAVLSGNNKDITLEKVQNAIQAIIDEMDSIVQNEIVLKIYVSRRNYCKIKCRF